MPADQALAMVVPAALADCNGRAPAIAQVAMAAAELATTHHYWTATAVGGPATY
jgi:hypothetical protein